MLSSTKNAAALGLFDGVHLGHKRVLYEAVGLESKGFVPVCFTFDNNSLDKKQSREIQYIYPCELKCRYIKECGIKKIFSYDFDDIRTLSPKDFVRKILLEEVNCAVVICGEDFRFGHNACADAKMLKMICNDYGIECLIVPLLDFGEIKISSKAVRNALSEGDMSLVKKLLGRDFSIFGKVFCDKQNGTKMGIPTVNLKITAPLRKGVYASHVLIDNKVYKGITNVGVRPTFYDDSDIVAETHILDFNQNIYDKQVEVVLRGFIRDEKRFDNVEELKKQIMRDIEILRLF